MGGISIPREILDAMVAHARAGWPNEACGIVAGKDGRGERFYPARNELESPTRYAVAPQDLLDITLDIEARGLDLVAIFHSHPATEAYPSPTDVRLAFYPDSTYLILSLADPDRPVLRGFAIRDGRVTERPVRVT